MTPILVTGYEFDLDQYWYTAQSRLEVIDEEKTNICNLEFPKNVTSATGALVGSNVVICGGRNSQRKTVNNCYSLKQNINSGGLEWKSLSKMSTSRADSASVSINVNTVVEF